MPVNGACIIPDMTPAIPIKAKFFSGKSGVKPNLFERLEKIKPRMQPKNKLGANTPPQPPPPLVALVANTLNITIRNK